MRQYLQRKKDKRLMWLNMIFLNMGKRDLNFFRQNIGIKLTHENFLEFLVFFIRFPHMLPCRHPG
jgi:hypothetical protein